MECSLECAAAAEDKLVAVDNLRSGLKGVLPARGISGFSRGQREPAGHEFKVTQSAILAIDLIEFVKIRVFGSVLKYALICWAMRQEVYQALSKSKPL